MGVAHPAPAAVALLLMIARCIWGTRSGAGVQAALLALALVHALLGARAILLDFGLAHRWHRALFALALVLAAVVFVVVWTWRWY